MESSAEDTSFVPLNINALFEDIEGGDDDGIETTIEDFSSNQIFDDNLIVTIKNANTFLSFKLSIINLL